MNVDARAKSIRDILHSGDRFLIPFFQRHYSWTLTNWQKLWEDLVGLIEDKVARQHFLGPLVCTSVNHMPGDAPDYQLIDGQQRLTTITIILSVLRDLARQHNLVEIAEDIEERFLIQKRAKGLARYKVVPRVGDREVLFAAIDGKTSEHSRRDRIIRACRYFDATISEYVKSDPETLLRRLMHGVTAMLSLVVITIDGENPYEIFESLNSTGLPLEESDLIRNFIFMRVSLTEQEDFHRSTWAPFEAIFEGEEDGDRLKPTSFYRDYLMRNGDYSRKGATFVDFKESLRSREVAPEALVGELHRFARHWAMLRRPESASDERLREQLVQLDRLDVRTSHPLQMNLLERHAQDTLSSEELSGCLADLASFVLRRSICGESTRGYHEMFPNAIRAIDQSPRLDLQRFYVQRGWPDDATLEQRLLEFPIYRRERVKCEVILETIESSFGHKEAPTRAALTVEHILPQSIEEGRSGAAWQEMLGPDWRRDFDRHVHTIGNLTLSGYNANLSNKPFEKKQELLAKSNLELNKQLLELDEWNFEAIRKRGRWVAKRFAALWPCPSDNVFTPGEKDHPVAVAEMEREELRAMWPEYWQGVRGELAKLGSPLAQFSERADRSQLKINTGRARTVLLVSLEPEDACVSVGLRFKGWDAESNGYVLHRDENAIEASLGSQLEWELEQTRAFVGLYLESVQPSNRDDWPRQHAWIADKLVAFDQKVMPFVYVRSSETFEHRRWMHQFWTYFNDASTSGTPRLEWPVASRNWKHEATVSKHIRIEASIEPNECWMGVGVILSPKMDAATRSQLADSVRTALTALGDRVWDDDADGEAWLGAYRVLRIQQKEQWKEYVSWMHSVANCILAHVQSPQAV